jgi:hypothetical protein
MVTLHRGQRAGIPPSCFASLLACGLDVAYLLPVRIQMKGTGWLLQ